MTMRSEDFRGGTGGCVRLTTADLESLTGLYACGGVSSFTPEHMEHNVFYGGLRRRAARHGGRNAPGQPDLRSGGRGERIHDAALSWTRLRNGDD